MPDASGTLETNALELGKALQPLEDLLGAGPGIFTKLGEELPREIAGDANIANKLSAAATKDGSLDPLITALATALTHNNPLSIIEKRVQLPQHNAALHARLN